MSENHAEPSELSMRSMAGLIASAGLAVVGLFALPAFQSFGLAFRPAFWLVLGVEFVALIGVVASVLTLHRERSFD